MIVVFINNHWKAFSVYCTKIVGVKGALSSGIPHILLLNEHNIFSVQDSIQTQTQHANCACHGKKLVCMIFMIKLYTTKVLMHAHRGKDFHYGNRPALIELPKAIHTIIVMVMMMVMK